MMKLDGFNWTISAIVVAALLSACGGGGDAEAGSLTAFSVVPSSLTITASKPTDGGPPLGQCANGAAGEVFVYGGAAPYRLDNTAPEIIQLDKSVVNDRGGSFTVRFINNTCASPVLVVVVDKNDRQVTLTLNNKPAAAAAN